MEHVMPPTLPPPSERTLKLKKKSQHFQNSNQFQVKWFSGKEEEEEKKKKMEMNF